MVSGWLKRARRHLRQSLSPGLKEFKGGKVLEIVSKVEGDTYRGVYTIEFEEAIYLLDAFQKKSKEGKATSIASSDG